MRIALLLISIGLLIATACKEKKTAPAVHGNQAKDKAAANFKQRIDSLEKRMFSTADQPISPMLGYTAIKFYDDYAKFFPKDTLSPTYLMKAGEIASNLDRGEIALRYFETIIEKYPSFRALDVTLFMAGFNASEKVRDTSKAGRYYRQLIRQFPNSEFADDAQVLLGQMGMTEEQLMQMLEKKNPL